MSDYGALTLPDHDLTPQEFKELARRIGRAAYVPLFMRYYERVMTSEATIEEQRRGLADIARVTGVEEDRKVDPNANLPVFNIIFGAAGTPAASIEVVEMAKPSLPSAPPAVSEPLEEGKLLDALAQSAAARGFMPRFLEAQNAEYQASAPAARTQPDLAEDLPVFDPTGASGEPAGRGAPHPGDVPRDAQQGVRPGDGVPPVPQALSSQDEFEQALASLDQVLGL